MTYMTYWHRHPRDFANECEMVKTSHLEEQEDLRSAGFHRRTRASMIEHLRWINRENESRGSNRAFGVMRISEVPTYH
jgi:hypothetical protein